MKKNKFLSIVFLLSIIGLSSEARSVNNNVEKEILTQVSSEEKNDEKNIIDFALNTIRELHTYDYLSLNQQLNISKGYFTEKGWELYVESLDKNKVISSVKEGQMVVNVNVYKEPKIITQGEVDFLNKNVYIWIVEIPAEIKYSSNNKKVKKINGVIKLTIMKQNLNDDLKSIGIQSYQFNVFEK